MSQGDFWAIADFAAGVCAMLMRHRQIKSGRLNRPQSKDTGALSAPAGQHAAAAGKARRFVATKRTRRWRAAARAARHG